MNQVTISRVEAMNSIPMLASLQRTFNYRIAQAHADRSMKSASLAALIQQFERALTSLRMNLNSITVTKNKTFEVAALEDLETIDSLVKYLNNRKEAK